MNEETLQNRFILNYPGVPIFYSDDSGIPKSVWLAIASGSKTMISILERRNKILIKLTVDWKSKRSLPAIKYHCLVWPALIHDNYRDVAKWLKDVMYKAKHSEQVTNIGELQALAPYFVYKTMDQYGNLVKIRDYRQVEDFAEIFYSLIATKIIFLKVFFLYV